MSRRVVRRRAAVALVAALACGVPSSRVGAQSAPATTGSPAAQALPDDALGRAMRDELARSMKELRLADFDRPYFIAYRVDEIEGTTAAATRGALLGSRGVRGRYLTVELRVGDYAFDNTNFFGGGGFGMFGRGGMTLGFDTGELPLDDDYLAFRRELWLATDAAYKRALESLNTKRAAMVNRVRTDSLPDFWRDSATQTIDELPGSAPSRAEAEALVRAISGTRELAGLGAGAVRMRATTARVRYVNSEGTAFLSARPSVELSASGAAQGADGISHAMAFSVVAQSAAELPSRDALAARARSMALLVDSLRRAPVVERYKGPVLFEGRAAAQLFADGFSPLLIGRRGVQSDVPGFAEMIDRARGESRDSLPEGTGSRLLPASISVVDDPTTTRVGNEVLLGGYRADDEGVPARRTVLVRNGQMEGVLASRTPVEGAKRSTGNRRGGGVAPSNLLVEARDGVTDAELRRQLLAAVQKRGLPYGLVVRDLGGGSGMVAFDDDPIMFMSARSGRAGRQAALVYRVHPDGREELVRAMQINGLTASSFRDIVAAGRTPAVVHQPTGGGRGGSPAMFMLMMRGGGPTAMSSFAVPSLLFDDVAMGKSMAEPQKPPIIPPPAGSETSR